MALKPKHKRRIFLTLICIIGALVLAMILIPPMITLNKFRPAIEQSIYQQMSVPAKLNGDIHFSLIGGATIVAHDVVVPTAKIGAVLLSIPFSNFFNMNNPELEMKVVVYDADITIDKLSPVNFNHNIEIYNSHITFMGRQFHIVRAEFADGEFHGTIRTADHKYDLEFIGDTFIIRNKNKDLEITGQMYSDGSIRGTMSLRTNNLNDWVGFNGPASDTPIYVTTNFEWDSDNNYKFTNLESDKLSGNIEILSNGEKNIQLVSNDIDFDFTFLLTPGEILNKTNLNLDFYGDLKFANHKFNHLKIQAIGAPDKLQISNLVADDIAITGGTITKSGAKNLMITMPIDGKGSTCLFSGTPNEWNCSLFSWGDYSGTLSVKGDSYEISVQSDTPMPSNSDILTLLKKLGRRGTVHFQFSDIGGTYKVSDQDINATYNYAQNKTLSWLGVDIPFLPDFIKNSPGDFSWTDGTMTFIPHDSKWRLSLRDNQFHLTGHSFKRWLPNTNLDFINDFEYSVSGYYAHDKISTLTIKIADHEFNGSVSGNNITLHTPVLSIDTFTNAAFIDNFAELEFRTNEPVLQLFNIPVDIALSAQRLIYNNNEYKNFVYSLKRNSQTFSIMDATRGNLLVTIEREKINYDIFVQLNRFVLNGDLLSATMPLNVQDTSITGQVFLKTYGQIAHDIYYNMTGTLDLTLSGGTLIGLSIDKFYEFAPQLTTLNAEYALSDALTGGKTALKHMRIIGDYTRDNFITTEPLEISLRHTDVIGGLAITDGFMTAEFDLTLRGTAPTPATVQLSIFSDNTRKYSLSDVMRQLDPGFMRAFIKTHTKF